MEMPTRGDGHRTEKKMWDREGLKLTLRRAPGTSLIWRPRLAPVCESPSADKISCMSAAPSYPPLSPALTVNDAAAAIDFYRRAFGAEERYQLVDPESGKIGHAELTINGALVMLAEEYPQFNKSPRTLGGTAVKLGLMSANAKNDFERAVQAGAEVLRPLTDEFYGHRSGTLRDPFGHEWHIAQELEKISPQEMQRRWNAMAAEPDKSAS
jgi:PhnB protein